MRLHAEAEDGEEEMVLRVVWNFSDSKEELMHLNVVLEKTRESARRSNQSSLKEISLEYSLKGC